MNAQLVSSKGGGGEALDELVAHLGLEGSGYSRLGLRLEGRRVQVGLEYAGRDDDEVHAAVLTAKFDGVRAGDAEGLGLQGEPPSILLRRETNTDRREKERGLTREVQTGFAGFDRAVFVDNDASEADARRVLSTEATRQAVLRLLEHHASVRITPTGVTVRHLAKDGRLAAGPLLDALEDLLVVARAGGPTAGPPPQRRGELLFGVAVGACTFMGAYAVLVHDAWPASLGLLGVGGVAGAAVALFSRPTIEDLCAGDSGSGKRSAAIVALLALTTAATVFGAVVHLNGALDSSQPELWKGVVARHFAAVSDRGRRDLRTVGQPRRDMTEVRWADGSTSSFSISALADLAVGTPVTQERHEGALGFTWAGPPQVAGRR